MKCANFFVLWLGDQMTSGRHKDRSLPGRSLHLSILYRQYYYNTKGGTYPVVLICRKVTEQVVKEDTAFRQMTAIILFPQLICMNLHWNHVYKEDNEMVCFKNVHNSLNDKWHNQMVVMSLRSTTFDIVIISCNTLKDHSENSPKPKNSRNSLVW